MNAMISNKSFDFSDTDAVSRRLSNWKEHVESQDGKNNKVKHFVRNVGMIAVYKTFAHGKLCQVEIQISTFGREAKLSFKLTSNGLGCNNKFQLAVSDSTASAGVACAVMLLSHYAVDKEILGLMQDEPQSHSEEMFTAYPVTRLLDEDALRIYGETLNRGIMDHIATSKAHETRKLNDATEVRRTRTVQSIPDRTLMVSDGGARSRLVMIRDRKGGKSKRSMVELLPDGRSRVHDLSPQALIDFDFKLINERTAAFLPKFTSEHFTPHEIVSAIKSGIALSASAAQYAEFA